MQLTWNEDPDLPAPHDIGYLDSQAFETDVTTAIQNPALRATGDGACRAMDCSAQRSR